MYVPVFSNIVACETGALFFREWEEKNKTGRETKLGEKKNWEKKKIKNFSRFFPPDFLSSKKFEKNKDIKYYGESVTISQCCLKIHHLNTYPFQKRFPRSRRPFTSRNFQFPQFAANTPSPHPPEYKNTPHV